MTQNYYCQSSSIIILRLQVLIVDQECKCLLCLNDHPFDY
jgi:hypothetical protein